MKLIVTTDKPLFPETSEEVLHLEFTEEEKPFNSALITDEIINKSGLLTSLFTNQADKISIQFEISKKFIFSEDTLKAIRTMEPIVKTMDITTIVNYVQLSVEAIIRTGRAMESMEIL